MCHKLKHKLVHCLHKTTGTQLTLLDSVMVLEHLIGITNIPLQNYQRWLHRWIMSENSDDPLADFQNHINTNQPSAVFTTLNGSIYDSFHLSNEIHQQVISHCFSEHRFVSRYFPNQFKKEDFFAENDDLLTLFCGVPLYLTPEFLQKLRYSALRTLPHYETNEFQHLIHQFYESERSQSDSRLITLKEHLEDYYWLTKLRVYQKQGWYVFYTYQREPIDYRYWYNHHEGQL